MQLSAGNDVKQSAEQSVSAQSDTPGSSAVNRGLACGKRKRGENPVFDIALGQQRRGFAKRQPAREPTLEHACGGR